MYLKNLNLLHFGCFHQRSLEFRPGFNVIYGENEAGKSTIHQFIQSMLFGVERLRGRASKKDEYARFQPWVNGKNYEGSMEIEHEGETYRLFRNFYKEDESFKVEQVRTGKEIYLSGNQIDQLIHGLNRSNFKNTLSIRQLESQLDLRFGLSLQAYMANVQQTRNHEVHLERTLDYLTKKKKSFADRNKQSRYEQLEEQMKAKGLSEEQWKCMDGQIAEQTKKLETIKHRIQEEQHLGYEQRRREHEERLKAIQLIEENNRIATLYKEKSAAYEQLKQKMKASDKDLEELSDRYEQMMGRNLAILFSVMIFGIMPVLGIFFLKQNFIIRMVSVAVYMGVLLLCAFFLERRRKSMGKKVDLSRLREEMYDLRDTYEQIQIPLQPYLEKYGADISIDDEEDFKESSTMEYLRAQETEVNRSLERLYYQRETMELQNMEFQTMESEWNELKDALEQDYYEMGIVDECIQIIKDLSEEIHSDFGPALNMEISRMIHDLTEGKYQRVVTDQALNLKVDTENGFVDVDQLSTGTQEQMYLALRLAIVKLIFPKKNVPVFFDDSFVFYDDQRLAHTLNWIWKQGFDQVLIFTCQKRERNLLKQLGIPFNEINLSGLNP